MLGIKSILRKFFVVEKCNNEKVKRACTIVPCYVKNEGKLTMVYYSDGSKTVLDFSQSKYMSTLIDT